MSQNKPDSPISMSDLAQELGVSVTTISRALSDHHSIGPATKQKVLKLAKKLNYQPNHMAAALRKGKSKLLGVMVPHIEGRFFPSIVHGIETIASRAGFNVLICQSHEDAVQERKNIETLLSAQVAGILVSVARGTTDFKHFEKVTKRNIPLVFYDRIQESDSVNAVVLNDREAAYQTTCHLLDQGCRRVAHLAGAQHLNIYRNRLLGYQDALRSYNIPLNDDLVITCGMTQEEGTAAMHRLLVLPQPPDAIFGAGDYVVLGALQVLKKKGIRVPQEMMLAGFSNEPFTLITEPQLTSVDQRCEEMGQAAVRLCLELLEAKGARFAPRHVVLKGELYIRESSQRLAVEAPKLAGEATVSQQR